MPISVLQTYISDVLLNGRMQVEADDDLLVGESIDSLGMMRLVAFVEETFTIKVPLEDITIQHFCTPSKPLINI
ncbi:MAG: acyl carrier protein [Cyanobacteria bacterium P01_H01_bin.105]